MAVVINAKYITEYHKCLHESSIKSKNFAQFMVLENLNLAFTTSHEDFKFSSNAENGEIGLFRLGS